MRTLSQAIKNVLNSTYGETRDVVEIQLKAQLNPPSPAITLYYANGEGVSIGTQSYENKLRSIGAIRFSLSSAPDNTDITIENVSQSLGFVLTNPDVVMDGAKVTIKRAFRTSDVGFESVTLFCGEVNDIKVDQDVITLSIVSDVNKRGATVGSRPATQRCIFKFNAYGSGIGASCGWTTAQPGNPATCSLDFDGTNGCKAHGNGDRYGGVPPFSTLLESGGSGYDSNGGGWGSGSGGGWCVHPNTWILCVNNQNLRYWIRAYQVHEKDMLVSMDRFGNFKKAKVAGITKGTTSRLFTVVAKYSKYSLDCSPSHPIITSLNDDEGTPTHLLHIDEPIVVGAFNGKAPFVDSVGSIEVADYSCDVIIFQLEDPYHIFVSGKTQHGGILSHNNKPIYTGFDGYQYMNVPI